MILELTLALQVTFTMPDSNAAQDTLGGRICASGSYLLTDLDSAFVWVQSAAHPQSYVAVRIGAKGREGQSYSATIPSADTSLGQAWVVTADSVGNRSCPSNPVLFHGGLLAAPPLADKRRRLYDVAGRLVREPLLPGVYFERRGLGVKRVVVLR